LLVVVAALEADFVAVEEVVAVVSVVALVAALVDTDDVDEEVLEVSIRIPPVEVDGPVLVLEVGEVELDETLELPDPELEPPLAPLMLCQLPLSSV